ncbi:MAG: hypothetical protein CVT96_09860 [Bacteroidetes bacterium HGW-Bacteroidetes-13]|nr:MAG: hypothetical protein CVT96_09860 [Bacteroidetes bacterium HGW-Bacteroidetes-13]
MESLVISNLRLFPVDSGVSVVPAIPPDELTQIQLPTMEEFKPKSLLSLEQLQIKQDNEKNKNMFAGLKNFVFILICF